MNDYVAAGYDRKVYIGKVFEVDDSDAKISVYEYTGTLSIGSTFYEPKNRDEIGVEFVIMSFLKMSFRFQLKPNEERNSKSLC